MTDGQGQKKILGNYEILGKIGQGGMGAVFRARQVSMNREVALKILPPKFAKDAKYVARFQREARSAGMINHPNLIQVYDVGETDGYFYFSMEFVRGKTLKQLLKEQGPFAEAVAISLMKQVATALEVAHGKGIVHRDVKPDNVLVDPEGLAKLADLGLAKPMDGEADVTMGGVALGTPAYMSPEQGLGEAVDGRSDLYSLGATFHHLLTGQVLFTAPTASAVTIKHIQEEPTPARRIRPELSSGIEQILLRLLAKKPEERHPSATALIEDLQALQRGELAAAPAVRRSGPNRAHHRGHGHHARSSKSGPPMGVIVGGGIAGLVLVILAVVVLGGGGEPTPAPSDPPAAPAPAVVAQPDPPSQPASPAPATSAQQEQAAKAAEMLAFAKQYLEDNPAGFSTALDYLERARRAGKGTVVELQAETEMRKVEATWDAQLAGQWQAISDAVTTKQRASDFDGALAELAAAEVPASFRSQAQELRADIRQAGERAVTERLQAAKNALESGDLAAADQACAKVLAILYQPAISKATRQIDALQQAIAQARQQRQSAAAQQTLALLDEEFDAFIDELEAGKRKAAAERVVELKRDRRFASAAAAVDGLQAVLAGLAERDAAVLAAAGEQIGERLVVKMGRSERTGRISEVDAKGITVQITLGSDSAPVTVMPDRLASKDYERLAAGWQPAADVDGALVSAVLALVAEDADALAKAVGQAGTHPLVPLLQQRVAVLREGVAEYAARQAWEAYLPKTEHKKIDEATAERLIDELDELIEQHAHTDFWQGLGTKPDEVRQRLGFVGGGALNEGLIAYYPCDAEGGVALVDSLGQGVTLRAEHGGVRFVEDAVRGRALWLDGRSMLIGPHDPAYDDLQAFSVSLWAKSGDRRAAGGLIGKRENWRVRNNMSFFLGVGGKEREGQVAVDLCSLNNRARPGAVLRPHTWSHLVAVFDGEADVDERGSLYQDGRLVGHFAVPEQRMAATTTPMVVGSFPGSPERFHGGLDEIRLYRRALDEAEVAELFERRGE